MSRMEFARQRHNASRSRIPDSHTKGKFSRKSVLDEHLQGMRKTEEKPQTKEKSSAFAKTAKRLWRYAVLSTPFIPACSISEQHVKNNVGWYVLGAIVVPMIVIATVQMIKANIKKPGPEKKA